MDLTFKQYLTEARKNPELNPKIAAMQTLEKYKDDPNVYISYRSINKIGINPNSRYNTPNGIYAYPLKEMWDKLKREGKASAVPFAGENPYIYVLKYVGTGKFVNDMYTEYTNVDFDRDLTKIQQLYGDKIDNNELVKEYYNNLDEVLRDTVFKPLRYYGYYEGNEIDIEKIITHITSSGDSYNNIEKLRLLSVDYNKIIKTIDFDSVVKYAMDTAYDKNPISFFWNISRWISNDGKDPKAAYGSNFTNKWNGILRNLGYDGFADKSGRGIIHPAEPIQAVFLKKNVIKVLDVIHNKEYNEGIIVTETNVKHILEYNLLKNKFKTKDFILAANKLKPYQMYRFDKYFTTIPIREYMRDNPDKFMKDDAELAILLSSPNNYSTSVYQKLAFHTSLDFFSSEEIDEVVNHFVRIYGKELTDMELIVYPKVFKRHIENMFNATLSM